MPDKKRIEIRVGGVVQGVGFRPFVFRLARRLDLCGFVNNNSDGVLIEIEGEQNKLDRFIDTLRFQPPPLAQIIDFSRRLIPLRDDSSFRIIASEKYKLRRTLISPDIATCPDCLSEFNDPHNRRFQYPFTNCTNCGPRYTIILDIPYDRPKTSMAAFPMCPVCQSEYDDPSDRRFHAQPNACPVCGPRLVFVKHSTTIEENDALSAAMRALRRGYIVAIKGLGGFHLAADATNDRTVGHLRERKKRFEKPLALMVHDLEAAREIVHINEQEAQLMQSQQRPIVLCRKKNSGRLSPQISPDNAFLGVMLPYTPLHEGLFQDPEIQFLVMTSANLSEEPICLENEECIDRMNKIADAFLVHDRDIHIRCDDSVLQVFEGVPSFIRRSRGYAPRPVLLTKKGGPLLAVGGHLKNTVCLTRDNQAFLSQHIGDLENLPTLYTFEDTISHLKRLFEVDPRAVIHDLHPGYLSTRWVDEHCPLPAFPIQHHYAHILSVMAEYGMEEDVIGISLDGTGYGTDEMIWGGEILRCNGHQFDRLAHFDYVAMPGGEMAILEPWRMAVAYLYRCLENGKDIAASFFPSHAEALPLIGEMIRKQLNSPLTSSCGRLFDTVAALLDLRTSVAYEGQAAVILEAAAAEFSGRLPDVGQFFLIKENGKLIIRADEIIRRIVFLKQEGTPVTGISRAFHHSLIRLFCRLAADLREEIGIGKVALSGGCFQNRLLFNGLSKKLADMNFDVYVNRQVPANDGGLCLGQAWWGVLNV